MSIGSTTWCAGETRTISVTVKNNGTAAWTDIAGVQDINIGVKWDGDPDYLVRTDVGGLAPGATGTFSFNVTAPAAGTNHLHSMLYMRRYRGLPETAGGLAREMLRSTSVALTINGTPGSTICNQSCNTRVCRINTNLFSN